MNRIRELRLENGWRQEDLALRLNTKYQSVGRYERGDRDIGIDTICALCDIFGVTADYLLGRSDSRLPAVSEADAALLRAYHAATLRDRALVDQILETYKKAADGSSVTA